LGPRELPVLIASRPSVVTFLVEPHQDIVRLTVTHENLPNQEMLSGISQGWPAVLANLKSLLETGEVLPQAPWEMTAAHSQS
jgi:Activator of Hsp90 ATPase homolog 1-like protein